MATSINDRYIGQLIRSAFEAGNGSVLVSRTKQGLFQCSMGRPDGRSYHVIVDPDPIESIYRCVVPWKDQDHTSQPISDDNAGSPFAGLDPRDPHDLFRPYDRTKPYG